MSTSAFFFGGHQASQPDMDRWLSSARSQRPDIDFCAFPWTSGASSPEDSVIKGSWKSGQFQTAIAAIKASKADTIYIVGHSSGCAIANEVDRNLLLRSEVVLVVLDGFAPSKEQLRLTSTQVWVAKSGEGKSMNKSLHYDHLKLRVGARVQEYPARSDCTSLLALHFSLVNENATNEVVDSIPHGYTHCRANLEWL
jgi:hypothetical protein